MNEKQASESAEQSASGSTTVSYRDAGVDIDAGNALVDRIKPLVASTMRPEVMAGVGGFGALVGIDLKKYREPVLVSGTDGVGTKLLLARQLQQHDTIGIDLVAMCANDILVQGAEPLFFLDYFACGQLEVDAASAVVAGIAEGCRQAGCALVGGETAEMPGMYDAGDYDLAGFVVGVADRAAVIDGSQVGAGHRLIGLASSGPHSNGYSLIRRLIELRNADLQQACGDQTLAQALMAPTRIYARLVLDLIQNFPIHAMSHITGGGLLENITRSLPAEFGVEIELTAWPQPEVFRWLQGDGEVEPMEMLRTFNCGIGFVLVVPEACADEIMADLQQRGEQAWLIGAVTETSANADDRVRFV
ncbi:MAG: phosphoribosylformylglycinamidine cyclo-ligase [Xanthomonadales bacterium]|nr:phosphoribosylformylglycinamidine cyclo-ligase [Xanthomonadales bacterium]